MPESPASVQCIERSECQKGRMLATSMMKGLSGREALRSKTRVCVTVCGLVEQKQPRRLDHGATKQHQFLLSVL